MKGVKIYRCKDKKENFYKSKGDLFDLPARLLLVGRSQYSGKSNMLLNLLAQNDTRLYKDDFSDIYIFSNSIKTDTKIKNIILQHEVPPENQFEEYDEDAIKAIFELTEQEYNESIANKEKPKHTLVILDDIGDKSKSKNKNNIVDEIFTRGRHINLSVFILLQTYTMASTTQRNNASGLILWDTSDKELDRIATEHSIFQNKTFKSMFRTVTITPFSYLVINYSNPKSSRYLNKDFLAIGPCGKTKHNGECPCL